MFSAKNKLTVGDPSFVFCVSYKLQLPLQPEHKICLFDKIS